MLTSSGFELRQYSIKHYLIHTLGAPAYKTHNRFLTKKRFNVHLKVCKIQYFFYFFFLFLAIICGILMQRPTAFKHFFMNVTVAFSGVPM